MLNFDIGYVNTEVLQYKYIKIIGDLLLCARYRVYT